ncbi:hypothetical protein [Aerococcus sp. L_32]|uniref:hypothetical protein n=1 Tax=Aerococcus sp. L_32 TaxID=3422316 RepID=UPI003D6A74F2
MAKINFKNEYEKQKATITNLALREARQPVYITFNFSFMTNSNEFNFKNDNLTSDHKDYIFRRLFELSNKDMVSLTANTNKKWGLESLKLKELSNKDKIKQMSLHTKFQDSVRNELSGEKFWVFRLCPNNNPYPTRIIGKMIDDTFYMMFLDLEHELYAKRK